MGVSGVALRPKEPEDSGAEASVWEKLGALDLSGLGAATGALEQDTKRADAKTTEAQASARRRGRFSDKFLKTSACTQGHSGNFSCP